MNKLVTLFAIHEVRQTLRPRVLKFNQDFYQLYVVLKLWVHHLDVLLILLQQGSKIGKCFLYTLGQSAYSLGLVGADPSEDTFCGHQNVVFEVITTHTLWIRDRVDLSKNFNELSPLIVVLWGVHHNSTPCLLPLLDARQILFGIDGLGDESSRISLDQHEFQNVYLLVSDPGVVEVLQVLAHLVEHVLHGDVHLLHDPLIDVSYYLLNNFELLEQFTTSLQHVLGEDILLTINPKVREALLRRVQYLCQVAE